MKSFLLDNLQGDHLKFVSLTAIEFVALPTTIAKKQRTNEKKCYSDVHTFFCKTYQVLYEHLS